MEHLRLALLGAALCALTLSSSAQVLHYEIEGAGAKHLGWSVAALGDVDGDGYEDFGVGSPLQDVITGLDVGRVTIHSGKTGAAIRTHTGAQAGEQLGWALAGIGDVNADGCDDYILGAPHHNSGGKVDNGAAFVHSGLSGNVIVEHQGDHDGDSLGGALCGLGDVDGDSRPDYALGAPNTDTFYLGIPYQIDIGLVQVFSGANHAKLVERIGFAAGDRFGAALAAIEDVSGDGYPDLLVGAPYTDHPIVGADTGAVAMMSTDSGFAIARTGAWSGGLLGVSLAALGDVDGNGKQDFIAGAPLADANGVDSGHVLVFSVTDFFGSLWSFHGAAGDQAGAAVADMGDLNGDGRMDFAYGSPTASFLGAAQAGIVRVRSGFSGSVLTSLLGPEDGSQLGNALASFDLNGDGNRDLLCGAAAHTVSSPGDGLAQLHLLGVPAPQVYCDAKVNSAGCTPQIGYSGAPSLMTGNNFHVQASKVLINVPGLLIWSRSQAAMPFGGGTLCLGAPVKRTAGQTSGSMLGIPCTGSFDFQIGLAFAVTQGLVVGDTIYLQYWSRDPGFAAPNNMNLTDALEVELLH